jgi:hypothetical protein
VGSDLAAIFWFFDRPYDVLVDSRDTPNCDPGAAMTPQERQRLLL